LGPRSVLLALFALVFVSACDVDDRVLRSAPLEIVELPSMRVVGVTVLVPSTLSVSEENSIKPRADIVWRGDPFGDRYEQVHKIVDDGLSRGVAGIQGDIPVVVSAEITRFHALTERTRYSIGGVHEIEFNMTVTNSETGDVVIPTYLVKASFEGYGGKKAIEAERAGITQTVRITQHLAEVIKQELTGVPAVPES
jgi:hypothetical protein